ncbi:DUF4238 domain-containing protein [Asticcacaulis sp.]|uniref:DUF4238 domain-containing protein n=1 Tax=Asticcacaulis sp. TaxID=1872648 RepID=UPI0026109262|nr:DUF4238 domain-containing protein [Asticcacaulis sp.]
MTVPRIHHYIPQFYLDNWTGSDGQLVVYRLGQPFREPFRCAPKNVCAERDLYANRALQAHTIEAQSTESKFFADIDDRAANALNFLLNRKPLEPQVRDDWARFLMSLFHRQPMEVGSLRAKARLEWQSIVAGTHRDAPQQHMQTVTLYRDDFTRSFAYDAEDLALKTLESVVDSERIGNVLVKMNWSLYTLAKHAPSFLTADIPTIKTEGLMQETSSVLLPVSPRHLFIACASERALGGLDKLAPKEVATMVNTDVIAHARQYIIANDASQTRFIQNRWPQP